MSASAKTSDDTHYQEYHQRLLRDFVRQVQQQPPFVLDECEAEHREFLERLETLSRSSESDNFLFEGQEVLSRVVAAYPHLMPLLHRDLLWFFGGDCLHYMPDEEIARFQTLDERRHEAAAKGEAFSYESERAKLFGLH
ncbi:PA2817 family protein [Marinimicrobium sp. ABcell2]|uniref:PA2817 family protein n=1 Tax=Marinimicrobium sp. ABcell2 TaxID=3069751 RepID=UPI0027B85124|nr:PA2817 family protein [Marinimicrobium sp. ABcell2]MDQ2075253.1 PA2817 family protein [Marinimicrobium sp. ABcell2]